MQNGFAPGPSGTIAVSSSNARLALPKGGNNVYVANVGATECFIAFGGSDVEAVAGDGSTGILGGMSIPPGFTASLSMGANTHVAAITAASTTTLRVTRGDGQ